MKKTVVGKKKTSNQTTTKKKGFQSSEILSEGNQESEITTNAKKGVVAVAAVRTQKLQKVKRKTLKEENLSAGGGRVVKEMKKVKRRKINEDVLPPPKKGLLNPESDDDAVVMGGGGMKTLNSASSVPVNSSPTAEPVGSVAAGAVVDLKAQFSTHQDRKTTTVNSISSSSQKLSSTTRQTQQQPTSSSSATDLALSVLVTRDPSEILLRLLQQPYPDLAMVYFTRNLQRGWAKFTSAEAAAAAVASGPKLITISASGRQHSVQMLAKKSTSDCHGHAFILVRARAVLSEFLVGELGVPFGVVRASGFNELGFRLTVESPQRLASLVGKKKFTLFENLECVVKRELHHTQESSGKD